MSEPRGGEGHVACPWPWAQLSEPLGGDRRHRKQGHSCREFLSLRRAGSFLVHPAFCPAQSPFCPWRSLSLRSAQYQQVLNGGPGGCPPASLAQKPLPSGVGTYPGPWEAPKPARDAGLGLGLGRLRGKGLSRPAWPPREPNVAPAVSRPPGVAQKGCQAGTS